MNRINQLVLMVPGKKGYVQTNFRLREFANKQGLAIVHPSLVISLERLREYLRNEYDSDVRIQITCGTRTEQDNVELAGRLGWTDEGGAVSRNSKHLPQYGGCAADIKAYIPNWDGHGKFTLPQREVGRVARKFFSYVKDDYEDGHVHVDQWDRQLNEVAEVESFP
jgi:hypothetical protein